MSGYRVSRGRVGGNPDVLVVHGEHGEIAFMSPMQPSVALIDYVPGRPWFYTGSPMGAHIIGAAWEAHAKRSQTITHPHFGEEPVKVFAIDVAITAANV